jgi:hypothetical protein
VPGATDPAPTVSDERPARRVAVAAVLTTLFVLAAGWYLFLRDPGPGPIQWINGTAESGYPAPDRFAITWGFPIGGLKPSGVLLNAEPVGVSGVDVLGIAVCLGSNPQRTATCGPLLGAGWPPPAVDLVPVDHVRFGPDPIPAPMILVGARRHDGSDLGRIEALRLTYQVDGDWHTYVVTIPWSLELSTPAPPTLAPSVEPGSPPPAIGSVST